MHVLVIQVSSQGDELDLMKINRAKRSIPVGVILGDAAFGSI